MVLVSIVVGLGIAELLGVVARVLRKELEPGLLHSLWLLLALFLLAQGFWAAWAYQVRSDWSFMDLAVFLLPRLLLFVVAAVLSPPAGFKGSLDDYFMDIRKRFFGALVCFLLAASLAYVFLSDGPGTPDIVRAALAVVYVGLALSESRKVQITGALVAIFVIAVFTRSFSFSLAEMFGVG